MSKKTEKLLQRINKMDKFLDWYQNKVKSIHVISNESFVKIMEKI